MRYMLIAVVSQDGFIARFSGHTPDKWSSKEEQEQFKFDIAKCNWSVMGKKTNELAYNLEKNRVIFTSSVKKILKKNKHIFFNPNYNNFINLKSYFQPHDIIGILGGTKVHDFFWKKKLITDIILTIEPVIFKKGLLLFSEINWINFEQIIKKNSFKLKEKKRILNQQGTIYLHYTKL